MDTGLNRTLRALRDPTRREILRLLEQADMPAGDIAGRVAITEASVSVHLSMLMNAELVRAEWRGQRIVYSLNATVAQETVAAMMALFRVGEAGRHPEE